jgi:glycosyltransferase involved in cell wall biosynthesis
VGERVRVCFLAPNMTLGGAERQMFTLMTHLDRTRFDPFLVVLSIEGVFSDQAAAVGIETKFLDVRGKFPLRGFLELSRLLAEPRADVVLMRGFSATTLGRLAARRAGVPVTVVAEHSSTWLGAPSPWKRAVDAMLRAKTSAWVSLSAGQEQFLIAEKHIPAERIHRIPNGIDVRGYGPDDRMRARRQLGCDEGDFVVGIVAVMRPEKDHATFLKAAAHVRDRHAEARFVIVGDGPERTRVEEMVAALDLGSVVRLTGARTDVEALLPAFDVFSLSSRAIETFPMTALEAMAAALPVVATRIGGVAELVVDGVTGIMVPPEAPESLGGGWERLLENPELRHDMGVAGRARVVEHFTADIMARQHEALFEHLLAERGQ